MPGFHQRMRAGSTTGQPWVQSTVVVFAGQHTNPVRAARRRDIKMVGSIRQFKRFVRESKDFF